MTSKGRAKWFNMLHQYFGIITPYWSTSYRFKKSFLNQHSAFKYNTLNCLAKPKADEKIRHVEVAPILQFECIVAVSIKLDAISSSYSIKNPISVH